MSIRIKTNIGKMVEVNLQMLNKLADTDRMLRTAATTVLGMMKVRIHKDGKDANGNQIGTYSPAYMKVRTGNYGNSRRVSRGKDKGSLKDAGVFTKGDNKGTARPRYNRTADTKVVASLTRQMEKDEKVIELPGKNGYGIGFTNKHNFDKSQWVEATYNKKGKIFALSQQEIDAVNTIAQKFVDDALSSANS